MRRTLLATTTLLVSATLAAPAAAQDVAAAEALFNRGLADMQAGSYETGCPSLNESYRLDPRPGTLFTLAECEAKRGRIATAATRYNDYLALFARLTPDAQAKQKGRETIAAERRAALLPEIPELTLSLPPHAPAGTLVRRDDVMVNAPMLGVSLPIDPGEHVLTTLAPGGAPTQTHIAVAKGEKKHVTLDVRLPESAPPEPVQLSPPAAPIASAPPAPEPTAPLPPMEDPRRGYRAGAIVAGTVSFLGFLLGGAAGGLALSKNGTVKANCEELACNASGMSALEDVRKYGLVSTIGFAVGIVGAATTATLLLIAPSPPPPADHVARRGKARGIQASADVWSADYDATIMGIRGVW